VRRPGKKEINETNVAKMNPGDQINCRKLMGFRARCMESGKIKLGYR
jgi:hypothetical protein